MMIFAILFGCDTTPQGWVKTNETNGPKVIYDLQAKPLPEIPLPNDQATRLDPSSPTGRRVNISEEAETKYEMRTRKAFNELDGFGTYASIMVSFDAPLDVADIFERHHNDDFRDDAVFLINVDPDCSRFGEEIALDMGKGHFPQTLYKYGERLEDEEAPNGEYWELNRNMFFDFDERFDYHSVLFEERNEDLNNNGILDDGEDIDGDGRLDIANFIDPHICDELSGLELHQCVADNLMTFYDRQANRLILRPLWPMQQQCTHAVLLTNRLKGEDGTSIQSPFPYINPQGQTQDVQQAEAFLSRYNLTSSDISFAWSFTTGSMTLELEELRKGLYGVGVFSFLQDEFPVQNFKPWTRQVLADITDVDPLEGKEEEVLLDGACAGLALSWLWGPSALNEWGPNRCSISSDLSSMGGLFGGTFAAPNLLADKDGIATPKYPADNDERWEMNVSTGALKYGSTDVSFWCALPQELDTSCSEGNPEGIPFCKPFPTVLYAHGYGGSRAEITLHMGRHTTMGYALCSLDSYGHGLNVWQEDSEAGSTLLLAQLEFNRDAVPEMSALLTTGRDRDLNNDGVSDPGADMWTSDLFHTKDMVRQSVLEYMQFVRILRNMDGENKDSNGFLLGDLDNDGIVDIGGRQNTISMWGISLGGIISGVLAGAEPRLDAVSPNAGGAGLADISVRARQVGVPEAVIMPMIGQLVVGCLPTDNHQNPVDADNEDAPNCLGEGEGPFNGGELRLAFIANDNARDYTHEFARIPNVQVGDTIVVRNLRSGEYKKGTINERGFFRVGIAADAIDAVTRRSMLGLSDTQTSPFTIENPTNFGDALVIEHLRDGVELNRVEQFQQEVVFQGSRYKVGSDLVSLQEGLGYDRNDPDFVRFLLVAQSGLSAADPAVWGTHTFMEPLDYSYDEEARGTRVLMMPTAGDTIVPVYTGVAMGRVTGLFGSWLRDESLPPEQGWREIFGIDERYEQSILDELVDTYVVEGDAYLQRHPNIELLEDTLEGTDFEAGSTQPNSIYDIDNVSDNTATFSCGDSDWSARFGENGCLEEYEGYEVFFPLPTPDVGKELRINREREDGSFDAFRIPVIRPTGQHGIYNAQPFRTFDADAFMVNFTVKYLGSRGRDVIHRSGCDCVASDIPNFERDGEQMTPAQGDRVCYEDELNICDETCDWGIRTPEVANCLTE